MNHPRRGVSLVECVIAAALLATVTVAGLRAGSAAAVTDLRTGESAVGQSLAQSLVDEICALAYSEPSGGTAGVLGVESGESAADKTTFDDVDDYSGWVEDGIRDAGNLAMPGMSTWKRTVAVEYAKLTNPAQTASSDQGLKRITVNVYHQSRLVSARVVIVSDAP